MILILLAVATLGWAHQRPPGFVLLTVDEGLSQNFVTDIAQDAQGFLWLGTKDGLNRYDGYGFRIFRRSSDDPTTLADNDISSLAADPNGTVWVGTNGSGLCAYDPRTDEFRRFRFRPGDATALSSDTVTSIYLSRAGRLWIGTGAGLDRLEKGSAEFSHFADAAGGLQSLQNGRIRAMTEDPSGNLLLGTEGGLAVLASDRFVRVSLRTPSQTISNYGVAVLRLDSSLTLWMGTTEGLYEIDWSRATTLLSSGAQVIEMPAVHRKDIVSAEPVVAIEEDGDTSLWFGTFHGIRIYNRISRTAIDGPVAAGSGEGMRGAVTKIFRDRSGNLWVGSNGAGVAKRNRAFDRFSQLLPSTENKSVRAIYEVADGKFWIGGYFGLEFLDKSTGSFRNIPYIPPRSGKGMPTPVHAIYQDPRQPAILWIGTEGSGLFAYDLLRDRFEALAPAPPTSPMKASTFIWFVHRDQSGVLWAGTNAGLFRADEKAHVLKPVSLANGSDGEPAIDFIAESRRKPGWLWMASAKGLFLYEVSTGRTEHYTEDPQNPGSLSHNSAKCVLEDSKGRLWIGTASGLNLANFDANSDTPSGFRHFTTADGLPNDHIYGILEDDSGRLWMSTNRGLSRMDPESQTFRNYDVSDGLSSNEFNSGAFYRAADGELFLGGINGFTAFRPSEIIDSSFEPPVVLTALQVANQAVSGKNRSSLLDREISLADEIHLSHEHRVVTIEFASLDYTLPGKNRYACMMRGFDEDWVDLGTGRRATYVSLPPGSYEFLARGSNSDGVWSPTPASIRIVVAPPVWGTWWFRLIAAITLLVAAYAGHLYRTSSIRRRNVALQTEIEHRQRTEQALKLAEENYRTIFERAPFGMFQSTPEGRFRSANPHLATIFGYESADELVKTVTDIGHQLYVDPEDRRILLRRLEVEHEVRAFPCRMRRKDGSILSVLEIVRLDRNPQTGEVHFEGMIEDVTERRKLEEQLVQAQKMESVGRLAGGVAHDFNNMLTVIDGYVQLALDGTRGTPVEGYLRNVRKAAGTAKNLTSQLLAFARKQIVQPLVVSPNRLLHTIAPLLRQLVGEAVELRLDLADDVWNIFADPDQFGQIIMNLGANARDAMPDGGVLQIETRNVELDRKYAEVHQSAHAGPYVMVSFSDTGQGIPKEVLPHIFEPFVTTKEVGQGTGLGLATVYGIVRQSGGHIWVYSEIERGTTFKLYFPRVQGNDAVLAQPTPTPSRPGREVILVVEDEELVRNLAASALRLQGYAVHVAPNGPTALKLADKISRRIDLLVTDVVMPKMSGKELASALLKRFPGVRVLYVSGYTENIIAHHGILDSGVEFLQKPYSPRELTRRVRAILDRQS